MKANWYDLDFCFGSNFGIRVYGAEVFLFSARVDGKADVVETHSLAVPTWSWHHAGMFLCEHRRKKDRKDHRYWSLMETVQTLDGPRQRRLGGSRDGRAP